MWSSGPGWTWEKGGEVTKDGEHLHGHPVVMQLWKEAVATALPISCP